MPPSSWPPCAEACEAGQVLEIDYHSASRDESTTRVVEPVQVVTMDGHWYLDAFCRKAGDMRRFRVDRLRGVHVVEGAGPVTPHALRVAAGRLPARARARSKCSCISAKAPSGWPSRCRCARWTGTLTGWRPTVVLDVAGMAWFERLLLQLGPEARVMRPADLTDLGSRAARRVLRLYEGDAK